MGKFCVSIFFFLALVCFNHAAANETSNNNNNNNKSSMSSSGSRDYVSSEESSKAYHAILIFLFAWILLFLAYLFHLCCYRHYWSRRHWIETLPFSFYSDESDDHQISRMEMGLKKEIRELLPIVLFKESFSVKDSECCVCLGEYKTKERLQQIPACGHIFHLDCIDKWLENHVTCPLCRHHILKMSSAEAERTL